MSYSKTSFSCTWNKLEEEIFTYFVILRCDLKLAVTSMRFGSNWGSGPTDFFCAQHVPYVGGKVSDSHNIFLWHISEDINNKRLFPKFQLIPILCLLVMHDYVHWQCSIDCCVELSLVHDTWCKIWLSFYKELISAKFLWGNVLLGGELQIDTTNSNVETFESTFYMKSGSMPLSLLASLNPAFSRLCSTVKRTTHCFTHFKRYCICHVHQCLTDHPNICYTDYRF